MALLGISPLARWLPETGEVYLPDAKFDNSYFKCVPLDRSRW